MIRNGNHTTDRGLSVALTHVLTVGITTMLIGMLLMGGSAMLDSETERSARTSLETIGERLAGEIDNVDRTAATSDEVTLIADHPRRVANSRYTIEVLSKNDCEIEAPLLDNSNQCVKLAADDADVTVYVPVATDEDIETGTSIAGGSIEISYDGGEIELSEADR